MTVGTVNFAAPEQLKGEAIDGRADQYALACTAFHLLAGVPPSIGAPRAELAGLDPVFAAAMAKEPSARFGSCAEFAEQLGQRPSPGFA
jgi:serine/threonine protein kinase